MVEISIIMPIHNAAKYLEEAIVSVLNQTYTDFELILINDKSTDNSKDICCEYCQKDNRIIFLENDSKKHGPGPTRNIGVEYATGEYIYFMDADDWIDKNLLKYALDRMQETAADIVQFGVLYECNDIQKTNRYYWQGKGLITKDDIKEDFFRFWKENIASLWIHFFKSEVVKKIRFEDILAGEDICYVMDALSNANKIAFIKETLYHYRYVGESISHNWNEKTIEYRGIIWNHQKKFIESFDEDVDKTLYAAVAYDNYIWAIYHLCSNLCPMSFREKKRKLLYLKEKMNFDDYRTIYPLRLQRGIQRIKYAFVKFQLEELLLLLGPIFLKVVRGE